ncbi:unnamed protein product [Schistosoma guineensis]|nr:unnamed protein product [Schistosoma guineensis]
MLNVYMFTYTNVWLQLPDIYKCICPSSFIHISIMKLILLLVLTILLLFNVTESKSSQQELIIESVKLWNSIKELWKRFEHKCQEKIRKYLEEDDLGEKIAAVLQIYVKRLNRRLDMRLSIDRQE